MKSKILNICLVSFVLWFVSCTPHTQKIPVRAMNIDSIPQIKNIVDIRIVDNYLYITYDKFDDMLGQSFRCYRIDYANNRLIYNKDYFTPDNGNIRIYFPTIFWDDKGKLYIAESDFPNLFLVENDSIQRTGKALISTKAKTPYDMALEARQAYFKSEDEYIFIGRQPSDGIRSVYCSDNKNDKLIISELKKIIYDEKYPSWIVNFGNFSYNRLKNKGAYAYQMFPAIQIYDFTDNTEKTLNYGTDTFNPNSIDEADIWSENTVQYQHLSATENYIYALYWGVKYDEMYEKQLQGTAVTKILKYDWNGRLLKIFEVNKGLKALCAANDDKTIIAYDGKEFFMIELN